MDRDICAARYARHPDSKDKYLSKSALDEDEGIGTVIFSAAMLARWLPDTVTREKKRPPRASGAMLWRKAFMPLCECGWLMTATAPRSCSSERAPCCGTRIRLQ